MTTTRTGKIRDNAIRVDIYNDGLTVLLYDQANENLIKEDDPKIIWFAGTEAFEDPASKKLLEAGDLLVYGMEGDGTVDVEILVGNTLSEEEFPKGKWFAPQTGFLSMPSGNLCVHSFNTLPMGDNGDEPSDEGAIVQVPAGYYKVTLYRFDFAESEKAGIERNGEDAPEIIVLTPVNVKLHSSNILFRYCLE